MASVSVSNLTHTSQMPPTTSGLSTANQSLSSYGLISGFMPGGLLNSVPAPYVPQGNKAKDNSVINFKNIPLMFYNDFELIRAPEKYGK